MRRETVIHIAVSSAAAAGAVIVLLCRRGEDDEAEAAFFAADHPENGDLLWNSSLTDQNLDEDI